VSFHLRLAAEGTVVSARGTPGPVASDAAEGDC
jgi:hypothetical protein